jgi:hypothetical protein
VFEVEINTFGELLRLAPPRYEAALAKLDTHGLDINRIVYCEAFDEGGAQIGHLTLEPEELILGVEVVLEHRCKGLPR